MASIESASEAEKDTTVKVMGGEDWTLWIRALLKAGVLAKGRQNSCLTPISVRKLLFAVYREGTIGAAKEHLENTAAELQSDLKVIGGDAFVSVNKALVTRASSVIPVVPLYISLLFKVMKEKGIHEGCIEQMQRMLADKVYGPKGVVRDSDGLVRLDDWEMREDVQAEVSGLWDSVNTENIEKLTDIKGFRSDFFAAPWLRLAWGGLLGGCRSPGIASSIKPPASLWPFRRGRLEGAKLPPTITVEKIEIYLQ